MTKSDLHNDHDYFREAIRFTSAETEFSERLIEKDYYCSIILDYLITSDETLTFKGGTCLNKIHAGLDQCQLRYSDESGTALVPDDMPMLP